MISDSDLTKKIIGNGIDVSYAQGRIDWTKLKGKIDFAIIRCGFGGDYTNQDDSQWLNNVRGCKENGIPFGVYLYSYANTVEKAKSEVVQVLPSAQPEIIHCNSCKHWTQSTGKMKGYGLGRCDFHDADLVTCNGFCYWAERRNNE